MNPLVTSTPTAAFRFGGDPAQHRSALLVAIVAGAFALLVCGSMAFQRSRANAETTWKSPAIEALKAQLNAAPKDERLQERIRELDLRLRQQYFSRLSLANTGAYLVFAAVAVFLFAAKKVADFRRTLPMPKAKPDDAEQGGVEANWMRWSVTAMGGLLTAAFLSLAFGIGTALPNHLADLQKSKRLDPAGADAKVAGMPSPEEMQSNWPRFRGADGNGMAAQANFPLVWDTNTGAGIVWKSSVPVPGFSSPIVWRNRVFLSGGDASKREVLCYDADSGALSWEKAVANAPAIAAELDETQLQAGFAAATMATDGKRVFAIFATGDLVALDFEGRPVWTKNFGALENAYGHASSLAMWQGRLIVQIDQGESEGRKSRLYALDTATGRVIWQRPRSVPTSWASPIVIEAAGKPQIITLAVPWVIAYSALDGTEIWRAECLNGEITPSPVFAGGLVFVPSPSEKLLALRPNGQGDVTKSHVVWSAEDYVPDITCPVSNGDLIFTLTTPGILSCYEVKDGKKHWEHDFETDFQASPSIAGNRLYLLGLKGTVFVIEASREFKELARMEAGEALMASPAFANDRMYLRGSKHLVCIGTKVEKLAGEPPSREPMLTND